MRLIFIISACAFAFATAACGAPAETTEAAADDGVPVKTIPLPVNQGDDPKIASKNSSASKKFLKNNAQEEGVLVTDSGLQYKIIEEGPEGGATPVSTDLVVVHYVGTLKDGLEFDSSRARGAAAQFKLNQVIPGWTEGLQLMSEGDTYRFFVPPELAYGKTGTPGGPIGPNEALIFDVELIKVQNPERNLETANQFLAENGKKDGVKTTASGLQYEVITKGKGGDHPAAADVVKVHYQGTLINGTEFDSSYKRGEPIEFPLNRVIAGWTEGVQLMSEGDKYRFFIPPNLAYGERGTPGGPIGPNEALIFEVELIEVK